MTIDSTAVDKTIPIVGYLKLDDPPHLEVNVCTQCGAYYFDHRDGCASCFGTTFTFKAVQTEGILETFTIVEVAAPGVPVPYVASVVNCDGIRVRANIVNVEPKAQLIALGMSLQLTTFPIGTDGEGTIAVGFGFEPTTTGKDS
jgi:uncharacterized OB-fold protein